MWVYLSIFMKKPLNMHSSRITDWRNLIQFRNKFYMQLVSMNSESENRHSKSNNQTESYINRSCKSIIPNKWILEKESSTNWNSLLLLDKMFCYFCFLYFLFFSSCHSNYWLFLVYVRIVNLNNNKFCLKAVFFALRPTHCLNAIPSQLSKGIIANMAQFNKFSYPNTVSLILLYIVSAAQLSLIGLNRFPLILFSC